jgi:hypothetical protein
MREGKGQVMALLLSTLTERESAFWNTLADKKQRTVRPRLWLPLTKDFEGVCSELVTNSSLGFTSHNPEIGVPAQENSIRARHSLR